MSNAKKHLVAMGRLDYQKGFDILIEAFARISHNNPNWNLIILGEGDKRQELEALINRLDLEGSVLLPGRLSPPFPILKSSHMFVMSSRSEGFGNVLIEAMACGLPVISFDCPSGPREIIRDGVDGVLVPPEDVSALASAMARLMKDEGERKRLAAHAHEVVERFGVDKVMAQWETLLEEVIEPYGRF